MGASNSFADKAATSNSSATVIVPIEISKSVDLIFGKFAPGTGGTVTVDTNGGRTASGGTVLSKSGASATAAKFDVTGDNNSTYAITWSGASELTGDDDAGSSMALDSISDLTAGGQTSGDVDVGVGTLNGSGEQSIYLGGILTVAADQADANYTGDVIATVEYN